MRRWRLAWTGPAAFRLGKIIRYSRQDLDAFIEQNKSREAQHAA
jgi:hypothetical protein